MEYMEYWVRFERTGAVADYLRYKYQGIRWPLRRAAVLEHQAGGMEHETECHSLGDGVVLHANRGV